MAHKYLTRKRTKRNASKSEGALPKESTIPTLPVEIIRMIFELVAFTIPGNLRSICLVCKMSNLWITPILYRTIVLKTLPKCRLFRRTVNTFSKRPTHTTFLATHTRALILPSRTIHSIPTATLDAILLACPNLTTLSCSASLLDDDLTLFPNLHALTHLSLPNLFEYPKILPPTLTHLSCGASVWDFADPPVWRTLFAECPALTHLCLSSEYLKSYGFIDFPLANLISALPPTILQLIFILVAPDSQWYMVDESVRRMQRQYLAEEEKRVVWMSVDRYGSLCDPLHPGFYAGHILAGKNAVAGVTGMDYPNEKEVDIWDLGRRVARHYASGYKVNGRRVSW